MSRIWMVLPCSVYLLLKGWHRHATAADLNFLLQPTSRLLALFGGGRGRYIGEQGYLHPAGNFVINAGCSGFNFLLFVFLVLFLTLRRPGVQQLWLLPLALLLAWPITVAANASRILSLLCLRRLLPDLSRHELIHQLGGGLIYFMVLAGLGLCLHYLPTHNRPFRAVYP